MHPEAYEFVKYHVGQLSVLEMGSYDVNGSIRPLFPFFDYTGLDRVPGPGVDVVGDAGTWYSPKAFDVVVCCEVLEHAENWRAIIENAHRLLRPGGRFIGTAAGPGRAAHTCGGAAMPDPPTEYYGNICPVELRNQLTPLFVDILVEHRLCDVRWCCRKSIG